MSAMMPFLISHRSRDAIFDIFAYIFLTTAVNNITDDSDGLLYEL